MRNERLKATVRSLSIVGAATLLMLGTAQSQQTINVNVARTTPVNSANDALADGDTVNVNAAINMAAAGSAVALENDFLTTSVFVGATGVTITVNATGSITTSAAGAGSGIRLGTGGVTTAVGSTITINSAATATGRSDGISVDIAALSGIVTPITNAGTITLVGVGGPGLTGNTADGIRVGLGDVTNSGTIITNDVNSAGVVINGSTFTAIAQGTITNSGIVTTNGNGSPGLIHNSFGGSAAGTQGGVAVTNSGTVTTNGGIANGVASDGILFGVGAGDSATNSGTINIFGVSGSGMHIVGGGGDTATNSGTIVITQATAVPTVGTADPLSGMSGLATSTGDTFTNSGTIYIGDQSLANANAGANAGGSIVSNRFTTAAPPIVPAAPANAVPTGSFGISLLGTGDTVTNSGTIHINTLAGGSHGINSASGGATITNSGVIVTQTSAAANGSHGISVANDTVTNAAGGSIDTYGAASHGINTTGAATITNSGAIVTNGAGSHGLNLAAGTSLSNGTGAGTITTTGGVTSHGINAAGAAIINNDSAITATGNAFNMAVAGSTVNNTGAITLNGTNAFNSAAGGSTINNSGAITFGGGAETVYNLNAAGGDNVTNSVNLNIAGAGDLAVNFNGGANIFTNTSGFTITDTVNGSIITAAAGAIITNAGTLTDTGGAGAHGITTAGATTINNSGTINVTTATATNGINITTAASSVTNSGTINLTAAGNAGHGIQGFGGDSITNSGTITIAGTGSAINALAGTTIGGNGTINMTNAGSAANAINLAGGGHNVSAGNITMAGNGNAINSVAGGSTINSTGTIVLAGGTALNLSATAADTASNSGTITVDAAGEVAVNFNGIAHTFTNSGTISDNQNASILTGAGGTITNSGTITDAGGGGTGITSAGALVNNTGTINLTGAGTGINITTTGIALANSGTITTAAGDAILDTIGGSTITHSGTINTAGAGHGINLAGASSTLNITGMISASGAGSAINNNTTANFHTININAATLSSGGANVINLADQANPALGDTVNVQGRVNITGTINGGGIGTDNDTLNISNMRLGQSLIDALVTAAGNPGAGTAQLFGSTLTWANFEAVNVDTSSIISYSSLLPGEDVASFGAALDSIATFNDADLLAFLNAFDAIPANNLEAAAINVIGQDTLQGFSTVGTATATQFTNTFMSRLPTFTNQMGGFNASNFTVMDASLSPLLASTNQYLAYNSPGLAMSDSASMGLATTAGATSSSRLSFAELYPQAEVSDVPENRFVAEVIGSGTIADQEATSDRPESDYFVATATLRGGYRINKEATVGAYAGYNGGEANTDTVGSTLDYDGGHVGIFAQYQYNNLRATALAGYTYMSYDSTRNISIPGINRTANADTNSHQILAAAELAYDFTLGPNKQWRISPIIGLQFTHMWIDGYAETGAGALSLTIGDQTVESLQTKIGAEFSKIWQYNEKSHITFFANGFWHHEILDNSRSVNAAFNSTAINSFTVQTENPERDFAIVGAGLDAVPFSNQDVHVLFGYQNQFGQDGFMSHTLYGGYRRDF